jgi:prepilin peptidase CpaA
LGFALFGFATGFGILLVLWLIGGGGGGDVKLMGALGAWVGASLIMKVFFVSAVLIAVMACGVLVLAFFTHGFGHVKKRYMASGKTRQENLLGGNGRRQKQYRILPYAVPVALGTWLVLVTAWHGASLPM